MDHLTEATEKRYIDLLERELVPALGCTEPIALAYASARVREVLGILPERFAVAVCGNILKNVKSVIVPNTNGLKGVRAAVLIGAIGGNAAKRMEVLEDVTDEQIALCASMMQHPEICTVSLLESEAKLHFRIEAFAGNERALVEVMHAHTNIVRIERNGRVLLQCPCEENYDAESFDYAAGMTLESILAFAETVPLERIRPMLNRQISCNMEIAAEGLRGDYGLCVGQTLLTSRGGCAGGACQGVGRRCLGCPHERLYAARGHQFRQRQPGRDGFLAGDCVFAGAWQQRRAAPARPCAEQPGRPVPEGFYWTAFGILRRGFCGLRQRRRHRLSVWTAARGHSGDCGEYACQCRRDRVRRRETVLRSEDCQCGRCGHSGF